MVAIELQKALAKEIKEITNGMLFKNITGKEVNLHVFPQVLPKREVSRGEERQKGIKEPFPYCIVRVLEGEIESLDVPQTVKILLLFGVFEEEKQGQGHEEILNLIQRVQERFYKNPILANTFVMKNHMEWSLQEEDTYPYYYGGVLTTWDTPVIRREEIGYE